jgi:hypothetical protein
VRSAALALVHVLRAQWVAIGGRTVITLAELDELDVLVPQLLGQLGDRDQAPSQYGEAALNRQRAFTLFVESYAEAHRCVQYLRFHEGDADEIAPSLYAGRGNGNHRRAEPTGATGPLSPGSPPAPRLRAQARPVQAQLRRRSDQP